MKVKTQNYNDITVVELQGELDADFAGVFKDTIAELVGKSEGRIVLDISDVGFIDSEGLEKLLWARDYCDESNCSLRLAGLDENCRKILEITRLEKEFDCYAELSEAVKSFV